MVLLIALSFLRFLGTTITLGYIKIGATGVGKPPAHAGEQDTCDNQISERSHSSGHVANGLFTRTMSYLTNWSPNKKL